MAATRDFRKFPYSIQHGIEPKPFPADYDLIGGKQSELSQTVQSGDLIQNYMLASPAVPIANQQIAGIAYIQGPPFNSWPLFLDYGQHINFAYARYRMAPAFIDGTWSEGDPFNISVLSGAGVSSFDPSDSTGDAITYVTGVVANDSVQLWPVLPSAGVKKRYCLLYTGYFRMPATITDYRFWCGLVTDPTQILGNDTATLESGMLFNMTSGQGFVRCITNDGGVTGTTVTTSVAFAANTKYRFDIALINGIPTFYIDRNVVATITTTLPADTTVIRYAAIAQTKNAASKELTPFSQLHVWF